MGTGITNRERMRGMFRLALALSLAGTVHLLVAGMIVFELFQALPMPEDMPALDLTPLELEMVAMSVGKQGPAPRQTSEAPSLPMRVLGDASRLGSDEDTTTDILRAIRIRVLTVWGPAKPSGTGRAVVVLDFDRKAEVTASRVAAVTGTRDFARFMEDFATSLQGLRVPETEQCGSLRVECEFRVGE